MSSLKRDWDGLQTIKKMIYNMYLDEEERDITRVTIMEGFVKDDIDKLRINRWITPLSDDPWLLKANLCLQRKNDEEKWIDRIKFIGYQYVEQTFEVKEIFQPQLRDLIDKLAARFMINHGISIDGLIRMVSRNLDASIAVFRADVIDVPFDALIAGYMKEYGVYSIGIHKSVEVYIDKGMFDVPEWDRTCTLEKELIQYIQKKNDDWDWDGTYSLVGDSEWDIDLTDINTIFNNFMNTCRSI